MAECPQRAGSGTSSRRPTGQWSLPRTSGRMKAPATRGKHFGRDEEIVDAPADVPLARAAELQPPGVLARQVGVEVAEGVDITVRDQGIHPRALLGQEAGGVAVLPRPRQVDLTMGGVDIAAEDHRPPLGAQPLAQRQERVVEGEFVRDAAVIAAAVGEVAVDQREIGVVGDDGAPLVVELRITQAETHRLRRTAREEGGAAVAFLARRAVPEGVVAGRLAHLGRELLGVAAGFLQAQDVRRGLGQPRQEAGAMGGAGAVDVPGEQGDGRHHADHAFAVSVNCEKRFAFRTIVRLGHGRHDRCQVLWVAASQVFAIVRPRHTTKQFASLKEHLA